MSEPPLIQLLLDGRRLYLRHGPIELIVEAFGARGEIEAAYAAAARRFPTILPELCEELALLRVDASASRRFQGVVARRMQAAVAPFAEACFITPMAAVAGAVAEEVLGVMTGVASLDRAYVNNGGDIALHLAPGESFVAGLVDRPDRPNLFATASLAAADGVCGIATSGWRGRSFSLGIADAVTVLAPTAALADAAATVVANSVDLPGHPAVLRQPANALQPDSDLGERLVTRAVGKLSEDEIEQALSSGSACAAALLDRSLVAAVALHLQGRTGTVGSLSQTPRLARPTPTPTLPPCGGGLGWGWDFQTPRGKQGTECEETACLRSQ